ncbi:MAG: hypothetical protein J0I11_17025 [Actinobacteria bacterium]|nr:hypothetical protein [Actinomycetota bacterium]
MASPGITLIAEVCGQYVSNESGRRHCDTSQEFLQTSACEYLVGDTGIEPVFDRSGVTVFQVLKYGLTCCHSTQYR